MLTLPIKQEWFDMICRGEKREEYREATEYYQTRINSAIVADPNCKGQAYKIFPVKIRAGYNSKAPAAILRVHCIFGKGGVREWSAGRNAAWDAGLSMGAACTDARRCARRLIFWRKQDEY